MSERPRIFRETEHGREVVDIDKEKDNAEMDKPSSGNADAETQDQKKQSTADPTSEKVDQPKEPIKPHIEDINIGHGHRKRRAAPVDVIEPKKLLLSEKTAPAAAEIEESNIGHGHRKRRAAPVDVIEPKKLLLSEKTAPAGAETDSPDAIQRQLENLNIGQRGGDHRIQGAVPRSLPEILVVQDPSGYVIAQATFHVPQIEAPDRSGEAVAGGSDEVVAGGSDEVVAGRGGEAVATVPGRSGDTLTGGSGEVEPGGIPTSLPVIAIRAREERYAKTIAQFNDAIPEVNLKLANYKYIIEVLPDYVKNKRSEYMKDFYSSGATEELKERSLKILRSCYRLDCVHDILNNNIPLVEKPFDTCIRTAKLLWEIYSPDDTSARQTHLNEVARELLRALEVPLRSMISWIEKCDEEVEAYNTEMLKLHQIYSEE